MKSISIHKFLCLETDLCIGKNLTVSSSAMSAPICTSYIIRSKESDSFQKNYFFIDSIFPTVNPLFSMINSIVPLYPHINNHNIPAIHVGKMNLNNPSTSPSPPPLVVDNAPVFHGENPLRLQGRLFIMGNQYHRLLQIPVSSAA